MKIQQNSEKVDGATVEWKDEDRRKSHIILVLLHIALLQFAFILIPAF